VKKVIAYIEQNGYIESPAELLKPPFDKPVSFVRMFPPAKQKELLDSINAVRDNAVKIQA
jgi:type I restriction enzyme R subunit